MFGHKSLTTSTLSLPYPIEVTVSVSSSPQLVGVSVKFYLSRDTCIDIYPMLTPFVPSRQYPVVIFHFDPGVCFSLLSCVSNSDS